jgi:quinol monooxygenase YgiN
MIQLISRLRIRPDRQDAFLLWCNRLAAIAARESGTLSYNCYHDAATGQCLFVETYCDADSLDAHLRAIATESAAGHGYYEVEHLDVCGDFSDTQRAIFASMDRNEGRAAKVVFYQSHAAKSPPFASLENSRIPT